MATITYAVSISGGSVAIQPLPVTRSNTGPIAMEDPLNTAKTGSLTTRTSNTVGTLTMDAGHGLTTGQIVDIYWPTGFVQYGVTLGTVATNSVPISGGSGDVLPAASTAVTVCVQTTENLLIDGDLAMIIAVMMETVDKSLRTGAHVHFRDAANATIAEIDLVANVPQVWDITGGSANPFTGNIITNLKSSQANSTTTETYTLKIVGVQDASP